MGVHTKCIERLGDHKYSRGLIYETLQQRDIWGAFTKSSAQLVLQILDPSPPKQNNFLLQQRGDKIMDMVYAMPRPTTSFRGSPQVFIMLTDKHSAVKKMIETEFKDIHHEMDSWHVRKNLKKKLRALGKRANFGLVTAWIQHILNHMYYCCAACEGDATVLMKMWKSGLKHLINVHSECQHDPLSAEKIEKTAWFRESSVQFEVHHLCGTVREPCTVSNLYFYWYRNYH